MQLPSQGGLAYTLDSIGRFVLIVTAALVPLFVVPVPWVTLTQSKMLFLAGALICATLLWMLARLIEGTVQVPRGALVYAALLLPVAYVASTIAAGLSSNSILGLGVEHDTLIAVVVWFSVFILTALLFSSRVAGLHALVRALVLSFFALFVFHVAYMLFPAWLNLGGFLQGPAANLAGNWHDLGILAGFALFGSVVLFNSSIFAGLWRVLAIALGGISICILILVHFTDVLWGAAALMLIAVFTMFRSDASVQSGMSGVWIALRRAWVPVALALFFALAALFGGMVWDKLPSRVLVTEVEVRPSWQGTFEVGRQSLGAPSQVIFGSGPNSFVREWGRHKPEGVNTTPFWNTDFAYGVGIIPTSVFAAGLVGLLAWSAIVLALLALAWRFFREPKPLFGFLIIGALYFIAFHMLYTPGITVTAITFMLMGLVVAARGRAQVFEPQSSLGSIAFAVIVLCAVPVVAAGALAGKEVISNMLVNQAAIVYRDSGDVTAAGTLLERALALSSHNDRAHRAAAELGLVEFAQLAAKGEPQTAETQAILQRTLQATIQHGLTAIEIDDANYQNWLLLAQVYSSLAGANVDGAYEEAGRTYERAFETNPTNPLPKLRLAQLAASRGDLAAARNYLSAALALKQDFAAAHFLLSQIEATEGNGDAAVAAAAAAVQLVPDDPLGWFNLGQILYVAGKYTDAAAVLEQAIARANDYSNALFYLSASYYQLGRVNDAVLALERVAALNPDQPNLRDAVTRLRDGGNPFAASTE